ncbi:hypothetical protein MIND_00405300 [Mycena indigotica]|uniref:Uncharacterized protein n=1 Tax=Mycena indigotica TaxID=2126181 RepID=A0A8H6T4N0_9AGAR|nr:uncharacterized protein MIND_00405300 [Mycena indigotica]KAF7310312.1 hypothetical protein MIND_00405300 [Mycena indigotica]
MQVWTLTDRLALKIDHAFSHPRIIAFAEKYQLDIALAHTISLLVLLIMSLHALYTGHSPDHGHWLGNVVGSSVLLLFSRVYVHCAIEGLVAMGSPCFQSWWILVILFLSTHNYLYDETLPFLWRLRKSTMAMMGILVGNALCVLALRWTFPGLWRRRMAALRRRRQTLSGIIAAAAIRRS